MRLDELFNTEPYDGEYGKDVSHIMGAKLPVKTVHFTQDDVEYEVRFVDEGNGTFWLNYGFADGKDDSERYQPSSRTKDEPKKAGNPYKVLSKVVAIAEGFLRSQKPRHLKFSGDVDNGLNEVYKKMGRLLADRVGKLGYEVVSKRVSRNSVYFYVTRDAEALTYGFSPVKEARLNELFDTETAKFSKNSGDRKYHYYNFKIGNKEYFIEFSKSNSNNGKNNDWSLSYGYEDNKNMYVPAKDGKDGIKVLGTIINYVTKFIKEVKPDALKFSGNDEYGLKSLYTKMAKYLETKILSLGYTMSTFELSDQITSFIIHNNNAKIPSLYKPLSDENSIKEARLNELYDTKTDVAVDDLDVNNDNSVGTGKKVNFEVDGVGYEMNFWDEGNNQWTLDYGYSDIDVGKEERYIPSSVNGKNAKNANKVMANIVNGLENFLKKQKPTQVQFTADKTHNLPKIYDKMVTYLAGRLNNLGYELKSDKWGDYSVYEINKR